MSGIITQNSGRHTGLVKAGGAGGVWTLIKTLTSDGSDADLSFVDGASDVDLSSYDEYVFKFINIHPETDASEFQFQANASGGSGYNETMTTTLIQVAHSEDDTSEAGLNYGASDDQGQGTAFQNIYLNAGNDNDQSISGYLYCYGLPSTTFVKHFHSSIQGSHNADSSFSYHCAGYFNTQTAIDEISFKFSADEIQGGSISLFGIS